MATLPVDRILSFPPETLQQHAVKLILISDEASVRALSAASTLPSEVPASYAVLLTHPALGLVRQGFGSGPFAAGIVAERILSLVPGSRLLVAFEEERAKTLLSVPPFMLVAALVALPERIALEESTDVALERWDARLLP